LNGFGAICDYGFIASYFEICLGSAYARVCLFLVGVFLTKNFLLKQYRAVEKQSQNSAQRYVSVIHCHICVLPTGTADFAVLKQTLIYLGGLVELSFCATIFQTMDKEREPGNSHYGRRKSNKDPD
jgi:hypothetical protein